MHKIHNQWIFFTFLFIASLILSGNTTISLAQAQEPVQAQKIAQLPIAGNVEAIINLEPIATDSATATDSAEASASAQVEKIIKDKLEYRYKTIKNFYDDKD
jgi:hypothetical protein